MQWRLKGLLIVIRVFRVSCVNNYEEPANKVQAVRNESFLLSMCTLNLNFFKHFKNVKVE